LVLESSSQIPAQVILVYIFILFHVIHKLIWFSKDNLTLQNLARNKASNLFFLLHSAVLNILWESIKLIHKLRVLGKQNNKGEMASIYSQIDLGMNLSIYSLHDCEKVTYLSWALILSLVKKDNYFYFMRFWRNTVTQNCNTLLGIQVDAQH
jgi:hypothetical protein